MRTNGVIATILDDNDEAEAPSDFLAPSETESATTASFGEALDGVVEPDAPGDNAGMFGDLEEPFLPGDRESFIKNAWATMGARFGRTDPRLDAHATGRAHSAFRDAFAGSHARSPEMNIVLDLADAARVFAYRGLRAAARRLQDIATRLADRIAPTH